MKYVSFFYKYLKIIEIRIIAYLLFSKNNHNIIIFRLLCKLTSILFQTTLIKKASLKQYCALFSFVLVTASIFNWIFQFFIRIIFSDSAMPTLHLQANAVCFQMGLNYVHKMIWNMLMLILVDINLDQLTAHLYLRY